MDAAYMNGKFFMSDVYGGIWGTTEMTIPETADKQALQDNPEEEQKVSESKVNTKGIIGCILLIVILAAIIGGLR